MPADWRVPLQWIKRLADLPALQYLLGDGVALDWMKVDPDISEFTIDDSTLRLQAMRLAGYDSLVNAWQQGDTMFAGWLSHWKKVQPRAPVFNKGLQNLENLLHQQLQLLSRQQHTGNEATALALATDYYAITDNLRVIFRRYAFQPAAVCAYLAIIALDIHHLRRNLMQRLLFQDGSRFCTGIAAMSMRPGHTLWFELLVTHDDLTDALEALARTGMHRTGIA